MGAAISAKSGPKGLDFSPLESRPLGADFRRLAETFFSARRRPGGGTALPRVKSIRARVCKKILLLFVFLHGFGVH